MSPRLDVARGIPVAPATCALSPVSLNDVEISDGFWHTYQQLNNTVTLDHAYSWLVKTGWLANFDRVVDGTISTHRTGREFADSEIYKYLEALSWEYGRTGESRLNDRINEIAQKLEAAQDEDGYLHTNYGHGTQPPRYSNLEWGHELYCFGHLIQAAVARLRTHGEDTLTGVARRVADHVVETFGPKGNQGICGHAEIEVALAEFGRATGEQKYIEQAKLFIDRHGNKSLADIEFGRSYFQDEQPLRTATAFRGHAVRANYLAAGALDVAVETGDKELTTAIRTQWDNTLARRTYVTGGMGSHHQDEAFGEDFELPSDRAYSETCAGIGSLMVAWRFLLADGKASDADHIERVLYNVIATSLADTGDAFFYTNTLHQRVRGRVADPNEISPRAHASLRAPWFEVSCCPTNISRTLASLGAYVATTSESALQIQQYATSTISTEVGSGVAQVQVLSNLPHQSTVVIEVGSRATGDWDLEVRVPGWARSATARRIPAQPFGDAGTDSVAVTSITQNLEPGYATFEGPFAPGDRIELDFGSLPVVLQSDPRIDSTRGALAVQHGPQILCVESVDLPDNLDVDALAFSGEVSTDATTGQVVGTFTVRETPERVWPYTTDEYQAAGTQIHVPLRPYSTWGNRGPATMRIWLPTA